MPGAKRRPGHGKEEGYHGHRAGRTPSLTSGQIPATLNDKEIAARVPVRWLSRFWTNGLYRQGLKPPGPGRCGALKIRPGIWRCAAAWLLMASTMSADSNSDDRAFLTPLPLDGWRLVTDTVMGGVSTGRLTRQRREGRDCLCLSGRVSTENNGGFVQMALDLDERLAAAAAMNDGIRLEVLGNGQSYNVHLRTRDLWLPWQSYRAGFVATASWRSVQLPFAKFEPYRSGRPLRVERLLRLGIVAIGRDFDAEVCLAGIGFYREIE